MLQNHPAQMLHHLCYMARGFILRFVSNVLKYNFCDFHWSARDNEDFTEKLIIWMCKMPSPIGLAMLFSIILVPGPLGLGVRVGPLVALNKAATRLVVFFAMSTTPR